MRQVISVPTAKSAPTSVGALAGKPHIERNSVRLLYYNRDMENYKELSDEKLVERIRSENQELYRHIVDRYQQKLMRYINYLVRNDQKAADIVQETFIKAFINLNSFDSRKKFSSWIYRISHNEAMNSVKKYHREQPLDTAFDISSRENPEEEFSKKEIIRQAHRCLDEMPVLYSEPLSLYYLEDRSYEEISDVLRLPIGTVGTRINRARILMKQLCQKKN